MHILNEIVKSRTVRRLGENSVQNVAWVTTTQKQDAGRFFEGEIGGQRYRTRVSYGVEEVFAWPNK